MSLAAALLATAAAQTAAPPLVSVGFSGRSGGACPDAVAARRGECVDVVDFFPFDLAVGGEPSEAVRTVLRDLGRLQVDAFDGLAFRWGADDVTATIGSRGYTALPDPRATWAASDVPRRTYALPPVDGFLGLGDWTDAVTAADAPRTPAWFPAVRYAVPEGQEPPPPLTRLAGRFAERMGYATRAHDFDLMDANPESSGPFFEQLFPYVGLDDAVYAEGDRQPLVEFRFPDQDFDPDDPRAALALYDEAFRDVLVGVEAGDAEQGAAARFERFSRVVYVQTTQFAMENYTTNQMRVLSAMTAMAVPPGALASEFGLARDLVAAARGETDTTDEILARVESGPRTPASLGLRYESLPREVVVAWVDRLVREHRPGPEYYEAVHREVEGALRNLVVANPPPLRALDAEARRAWLKAAVLPGEDREEVDTEVMRIALATLVVPPASLPALRREMAPERDRMETWMLADQARLAIAATFHEDKLVSPRETVEAATGQWAAVLSSHGFAPEPIPQGLGAVDPTSVCTTLDGVAALDEPAVGPVSLDVLVAVAPGLEPRAVLDAAAPEMPFRMVDDPVFEPAVERIVDLGDGRTLYRVRWRLWSGWHLFWDAVPHDEGHQRLVLRTGAICGDTVLAPPDLVATVVRAGLLQGNLRPTTPETREEWKAWRDAQEDEIRELDPDAIAGRAAGAPAQAQGQAEAAKGLAEAPPGVDDLGKLEPTLEARGFEIVEEPLGPAAQYFTALAQRPLLERAADQGLLVFVYDATAPGEAVRLGDLSPRTPYARVQSPVNHGGGHVRTAAWTWWFDRERPRPVPLTPGWSPKDSVQGGLERPRWQRRRTLDFWFATGANGVPTHVSTYGCSGPAPNGFAGPCDGAVRSAGGGIDLQGLTTWWFHDRPHYALDAGLDARLGFRPGGQPPLAPDAAPRLAWALRPQVGLVLGLRAAPRAGPLHGGARAAHLWGVPGPDGRSPLGRTEWGVRTFLVFGPGYEGIEANTGAEGWLGWTLRRARSSKASLTPYHPGALLGPYVRFEYGFPVGDPPEPRYLTLRHTTTVSVGARVQLRLNAPAPTPE